MIPFSAAEMMTIPKPVHIQAITMISMKVLTLNAWTCVQGTGPSPITPMAAFSVPVWMAPGGLYWYM